MTPNAANLLTVVITSHQRPKHLLLAFHSCLKAGVKHLVVAATGDLSSMRQAFDQIKRLKLSTIILEEINSTSNQSWLHGVEVAPTEYVALLHDDDLLLPEYLALVTPGLLAKAPFVQVQASNHGVPNYIDKDSDTLGWLPSKSLRPRLEHKGALSISPVRGVFRKSDLSEWLRIAEGMPESCYLRPGFLVGNDLLIWLKATDKYPQFFNVPRPAVSFGHWEGSTTVRSLGQGDGKLFRIYDETRRWLQSGNLPLHIVTIVLDGMPFITQHLAVFNRLKLPWHWHIVEGAAANKHCTKWCRTLPPQLSRDGTREYLDQIASHPRVHLHRRELWDGKVEMVNAPLPTIREACILLEVDCDEFWTAQQIESIVKLFQGAPDKSHAMFWCRYFFGPHLVMTSRNCYGNNPAQDWKRAWRFKPGDKFLSHEPPVLSSERTGFSHQTTEALDLVFDHYGYVQRSQVSFKEYFYYYAGAVKAWEKLQRVKAGEVRLSDYLPWVPKQNSATVKAIE